MPLGPVEMDSNGHSALWGPEEAEWDKIGEFVEDVIVDEDLLVVNHRNSLPFVSASCPMV